MKCLPHLGYGSSTKESVSDVHCPPPQITHKMALGRAYSIFSPRNGGAFAVYKSVFIRQRSNSLLLSSPGNKFWRENSNVAGVPHLNEVGHHGIVGHGAGVPHLDELGHHGAVRHGLDGLDIMGMMDMGCISLST